MPPKLSILKPTLPVPSFSKLAGLRFSTRGGLLLALISGICMGLTPAPVNAWMLSWVALAPLWILVLLPQPTSRLRWLPWSVRYALTWGIGYHGLALSWIRDLHPLTWMGVPWLASVLITGFCWLFITLWGAALVAIWAILLRRLVPEPAADNWVNVSVNSNSGLRILVSTAIWCGLEALWGKGVLYWTSLSYTQSPHNLAILHLGQISGPLMVTAAIVAFNGFLAEAGLHLLHHQIRATRQLLSVGVVGLIALHGLGFWLYSQPLADSTSSALRVGLVQGNVPTRIKLFEQGLALSLQNYLNGYTDLVAQGAEAVLTPEGAMPWLWVKQPTDNPLYRAIQEQQVPAWIGTVGLRQGRVTQTLFSIDGRGEFVGRYDKIKLVPLGEYIPFESVLGGLIQRLSPVGSSMLPGEFHQQLQTPFGPVIAGICYESAFPDLFRWQAQAGGQLILTASNNDPYGAAMMAQHHAQDTMRAIETSRWAVRSTNTGFSGIVDPHGRTQWLSGFRTTETHLHTVYRRQTQTLYTRWGNWLTPALLTMAALAWMVKR